MGRYVLTRSLQGLLTLWLVTGAVFFLVRLTGNPIHFLISPEATPEDRQRLIEYYGFDKSYWEQYINYNKNFLQGKFGESLRWDSRDGLEVFLDRLPATIQLTLAAMIFSIAVGVTLGVLSATNPDSPFDRVAKVVAILGQSMPVFWVGILMILVFAVYFKVLPAGGSIERLGTDPPAAPVSPPGRLQELLAAVSSVRSALRGVPKFSFFYLSLIIFATLFAPWIAPFDPIKTQPSNILAEPSWGAHMLGTDHLGRDILSRMIYGARISVVVGFMAVFISGTLGTLIALVSGVARGWVDTLLMRITDGFLALPYLMVAVTVIAILGAGLWNVILVIALLRWMTYARIVRGEVLQLMQMDYIRLARVAGSSNFRIIFRHVAPNVINTLLVLATLEVGLAIIAEASLSYLGLGIPRPQPSWGTMLAESQEWVFVSWWLPMVPGIAITLLVMSFNLMGDWLHDRTDPTRRQL